MRVSLWRFAAPYYALNIGVALSFVVLRLYVFDEVWALRAAALQPE